MRNSRSNALVRRRQSLVVMEGLESRTLLSADLIGDLNPYATQTYESTVVGTAEFFTIKESSGGVSLYRSDGTQGGSTLVQSANQISSLTAADSVLYYIADDGLGDTQLVEARVSGDSTPTVLLSLPKGTFNPYTYSSDSVSL